MRHLASTRRLILLVILILTACIVIETNYAFAQMPGIFPSNDSNVIKTDNAISLTGKISPANGTSVPGNQITFTWTGPTGYYYWIIIGNGPYDDINAGKFANTFYKGMVGLNATSITLNNFPADGMTYQWIIDYCSLIDYGCTGGPFDFWSFTNTKAVPAQPVLSSPPNSGTASGTTITFSWNNTNYAEKYHIQVYDKNGTLFKENTSVTSLSTSFSGFPDDNSTFTWHVRAGNSTGWGPFSATWQFTNYPSQPPAKPILSSPTNTSTKPGSSICFTWEAVARAQQYHLEISKLENFGTIFADSTVGSGSLTSCINNKFENEGCKYYWRFTAQNTIF